MLDIVFAHPHTKYDSYTDYRRLAELSGFEVVSIDDINVDRNALYITCPHNGETGAALKARPKSGRKCKVALWFLERPAYEGHDKFRARTAELLATELDYIWFSDNAMFNVVSHLTGTMFVPMGSDGRLGIICQEAKHYDYCHMSYVWGRRSFIDNIPAKPGNNCWGNERHEVLTHSKFMFNIHQDNDNFHEPLRFALCAAYAIPMISETCTDPFPYVIGTDFIPIAYENAQKRLMELLKEDYNKYIPFGSRMHAKATGEFSFINNLKRAAEKVN